MKTLRFFNKTFLFATALASAIFITSCEKDSVDDDDDTFTVSGNASGSQEVPAVATSGSATLIGTYNSDNNRLDYSINWSGLSGAATVAHFHGPAVAGVSAGPLIDLIITVNGVSGTAAGSATLSSDQESYLLAGTLYYNIHTAAHVDGEIRGQVTATPN
jgi:CHRD domain-containing protein